jgi:hypothetical protein
MTTLVSRTTGEIYESSLNDFLGGIALTVKLRADHPFRDLWQDFRTKITTPYMCKLLIDCFVAVMLQNDRWTEGLSHSQITGHHDQVISLLRDNPPDLVVLDQPTKAGYGMHQRREGIWPYICITKYWVDKWTHTMNFDPNIRLSLSYETVLKATIVHGLSHWFLTLVCAFYFFLRSRHSTTM